jgi:hypothetical protein
LLAKYVVAGLEPLQPINRRYGDIDDPQLVDMKCSTFNVNTHLEPLRLRLRRSES